MKHRRPDRPSGRRRTGDIRLAAAAGAGYLALGALAARTARPWERKTFHRMNHDAGHVPLLRLPQQMGTPWVLPALGVFGFQTHRPHLAVSASLALPVEKAMEVAVKKVTQRRRPAKVQADARLRDDAPTSGPSYPSGHAGIAYAAVVLVAPYVPRSVTALLAGTATAATVTRVHQGAHYPLDAVGGVFLGVSVGSVLNAVFGVPGHQDRLWTRGR